MTQYNIFQILILIPSFLYKFLLARHIYHDSHNPDQIFIFFDRHIKTILIFSSMYCKKQKDRKISEKSPLFSNFLCNSFFLSIFYNVTSLNFVYTVQYGTSTLTANKKNSTKYIKYFPLSNSPMTWKYTEEWYFTDEIIRSWIRRQGSLARVRNDLRTVIMNGLVRKNKKGQKSREPLKRFRKS